VRVLHSSLAVELIFLKKTSSACVRNGIHYVDLTGETPWVKQIIVECALTILMLRQTLNRIRHTGLTTPQQKLALSLSLNVVSILYHPTSRLIWQTRPSSPSRHAVNRCTPLQASVHSGFVVLSQAARCLLS